MSHLWLRVAVLLYGVAALAVLPAALYNQPRWRHVAFPAALAGVFFHFVSLAEMLSAAHHALPVDTHETLSLLGLLLAALIASLLYLVQERRLKRKLSTSKRTWIPPLETLDQIALKALLFGFPCMTAGLLIGSVVALETIGPTFFADPKVLLSLAMWIAYSLMIFIRRHSGLRGRRAVYLSSFVFLVVLAVWSANQLSVVHRFTTP
jgi:ABC-type uncharacterized transport system permease subunit